MIPSSPTLVTCPDGRLGLVKDGVPVPVGVGRCFPWTSPDGFLSLRDEDGGELALVESPDDLDSDSREALRRELDQSGRTFTVTGIDAMGKEIELRCWEVRTAHGPRSFQTELDEWPRKLPDGGLLIEDLFGDLYRIPDPRRLDPASRKILWPLMD